MARTSKKASKQSSRNSRLGPVPKRLKSNKVAPHGAWNELLKGLKRISTSEGRIHFAELVEAAAKGDMFVVDRYGRAKATLVPPKGAALLILLSQPQNAKALAALEAQIMRLVKP